MREIKYERVAEENGRITLEDLPISKGDKVKIILFVDDRESLIEQMAYDEEIQREIKDIDREFAETENDGLGEV